MAKELRSGYTTGSCATAAAVAALEKLLTGKEIPVAEVISPEGRILELPILKVKSRGRKATGVVTKDAGDDPDVTHGINICSKVEITEELPENTKGFREGNILILGGRGVGTVTKKGLQVEPGKSAINPGPQKMIFQTLKKLLEERKRIDTKVVVKVYIPQGIEKAAKTFNPKLGIKRGISVLGSTGIVKPMSEEAMKASLYTELKVLRHETGRDWAIFGFGNHGKSFCEKMGMDTEQMVLMSNYVGFMLESAYEMGFRRIFLVGHIGKMVKVSGGIFNTHSRTADARMEIMAANAFLAGERKENIEKILESNTLDEACGYVTEEAVYRILANKAAERSQEYVRAEGLRCEALLFSFEGKSLGCSDGFYAMAGEIIE